MYSELQSALVCGGKYIAFGVAGQAELTALNPRMLLTRVLLNRRTHFSRVATRASCLEPPKVEALVVTRVPYSISISPPDYGHGMKRRTVSRLDFTTNN